LRIFCPFLAVVFVLGCLLVSFAGGRESRASRPTYTPIDSYGNLCWEEEQARLNNFATQLQGNPALTGFIIVYAGRASCRGEAKYRAERAKKWITKHGIKAERIILKDGGYRERVETVLQPMEKNNLEVLPTPTLKPGEVSVSRHCIDKTYERVVCLERP
jgi:hypothetical protein